MYNAVLVDIVASGARWPLDLLFKVDSVFDSEKNLLVFEDNKFLVVEVILNNQQLWQNMVLLDVCVLAYANTCLLILAKHLNEKSLCSFR